MLELCFLFSMILINCCHSSNDNSNTSFADDVFGLLLAAKGVNRKHRKKSSPIRQEAEWMIKTALELNTGKA